MRKILDMEKSAHLVYSGSVQGVGFRFTAERVASSLGLNGYVKNLRDGRVEVLCEGKESLVKEFIARIDSVFKAYIKDVEVRWSGASGEREGFDILFDR